MAASAPIAERAALAAIHPEQEYFSDGISNRLVEERRMGHWWQAVPSDDPVSSVEIWL